MFIREHNLTKIIEGEEMPYIKKYKRLKVDKKLEEISKEISESGELNYCIYKLCKLWLDNKEINYDSISDCIKTLECAKLEFYRMILSPYEDIKIKKNGNVEPVFEFI